MCVYCEWLKKADEGADEIEYRDFCDEELKINDIVVANLSVGIDRFKGEVILSTKLHGRYCDDEIVSKNIPISYCPICGRKLN